MEFAMDLTGKVAWVTGGGSGIGRATAIRFAEAGADVAILARSEDELRETADAVEKTGAAALILTADTRVPQEMKEAAEQIVARWQQLDIVVANAGINGVW